MLKAIFFDFDGVIVESVDLKAEAFAYVFRDYPEHKTEIVNLHHRHGGVSRFEKFKWIYRDILKEPLTEQKLKELGDEFSVYVFRRVIESPFTPGAREFLRRYHERLMFFIVSGTPEEEIRKIVRGKELQKYFRGVYGTPADKGTLTVNVLKEHKLEPSEAVFVGDAMSDYEGAKAAGVGFVARIKEGAYDPFKDLRINKKVKDIFELESFLLETGMLE